MYVLTEATGEISYDLIPSARLKQADFREKFTSDLQEKGQIKIDSTRPEVNALDVMTKNVTED
jgi:hypothetical protein